MPSKCSYPVRETRCHFKKSMGSSFLSINQQFRPIIRQNVKNLILGDLSHTFVIVAPKAKFGKICIVVCVSL